MALRFEKTCDACPEQYDVYDGDKQVAYIRLRWGELLVTCPDVGGDPVYHAYIGKDGWDGSFENEAQRENHLSLIEVAIQVWMEKEDV